MNAAQVSTTFQRVALATALTVSAFFIGNVSPQIFLAEVAGDGPLSYDLPIILFISLLCVAGFLAILNTTVTFKKVANILEDFPARSRHRRLDCREEERSTGVTEPQAPSDDLFELSQDALMVANAEGVVLELNRKAETMFGWTRGHLLGQPVEILIPGCELARHAGPNDLSARQSGLRGMASERQKLRGVRKDGTTFAVEVSLSHGRSGGAHAVVASICTVVEPVPTSASLHRDEFTRDRHAVGITEHNDAEQQRHALYAGWERRLTHLIDNSTQSVNDSMVEQSIHDSQAQTSLSADLAESRVDDSLDEWADSQWATRWADQEKSARASALSLLSVIDEMKGLPEIDNSRLKLAGSPDAAKQRIEKLCDRLFPASRIMPS